ncbi:MAG: hypothetical protein L6R38_008904 [Xanthoria sp. 2 TBL-2021]|nr:MAG: hypothetical protein L6R38_008904 [Xanthoria sp. 2 TBL-2021]
MDDPRNPTPNPWAYPSRPPSNISYNHVGPSNSSSPVHAAAFVPMYPSPHGAHGPLPNPMGERQRQIMELNPHNRQNLVPQHHMNGSGHHAGYFNYPTPSPFQPQTIPHLPPADGLNDKQRQARDLITQLNQDKKVVLEARKKTAVELQRRISELKNLEASQRGAENLRYIYPLQADIVKKQSIHDGYGREWDKVEELLEICWAELMAPGGG